MVICLGGLGVLEGGRRGIGRGTGDMGVSVIMVDEERGSDICLCLSYLRANGLCREG